jgi:hypothetical protein
MPPSGEADGMTDSRNSEPPRQRHRIVLRGPHAAGRHHHLEAKQFRAGRAVAFPVQPRVVGENLESRANNERHEKQVHEMLQSEPGGESRDYSHCGCGIPG